MSNSQGATPQWQPQPPSQQPPPPPQPRKKHRVFLWVFLGVQILFLILLITGIASGSGTPEDCGTLEDEICNDAENTGTAIGVGLVIVLWAVVDVILGVTYAVYRLAKRP